MQLHRAENNLQEWFTWRNKPKVFDILTRKRIRHAIRKFNYGNMRWMCRNDRVRYPMYSDNSSLIRSNLLPWPVCIDATAKPRTYVATSKIQYAQLRDPPRWTRIYRWRWNALPCLADATRVPVSCSLTWFPPIYGLRHANTRRPTFCVRGKTHPYELVVRAISHSMHLACKHGERAKKDHHHTRVARIFRW